MPDKVPLDQERLAFWRGEIERSVQADAIFAKWWEANLKNYAPLPTDDPETYGSRVNVNRDFTLVERKKADLFYQRPDVECAASPLMAGQEQILGIHADILNEKLGADGVNAKRLAHQCIFDVLCPVGTAWTYMGYDATTIPTETTQPDPITGEPVPVTVAVPIHEELFWRHVPPKQRLLPASFRSTNWDDAPWLGMRFEMPIRSARRRWNLSPEVKGSKPVSDQHFTYGGDQTLQDDVISGALIYYKSALYRDDIAHPQHLTRLVILDTSEIDDPVVEHKDAPEQSFDAQGRLTPDSLVGFPFHPLTIRVLTDSAHVPSDCTVSRPLVNELNRFREQMVEQRDASILRWYYNTDTLPPDAVAKMVRSPVGGMIGVPAEAFAGEGAIKEMPHGTFPRENFQFNDYLDNDLARTHSIDATQSGVQSPESKTATETQLQQSNANARLDLERGVVLDWYVKGVTKFSTLLQRYLSVEQAAAIVGPKPAQQWDAWRRTVPAALAFTAQPDSALRTDLAWERKRALEQYTYFANDPFINRPQLLKELLPKLHLSEKVFNAQPPAKQAEPAKPTFSFKGEDLNPSAPQFAIVLDVLKQTGVTISPEALAEAQAAAQNALLQQQLQIQQGASGGPGADTQHGGKVPQAESLDKHQADQTGGLQGTGMPAAMGSGGIQ